MNEYFYRNWSILVIIAVVLISMGISSWVVNVNFSSKGLEFRKVNTVAFKSLEGQPDPGITLLVDGNPVQDAFLTTVVVRNTGAYSIKREDYEEPIQFHIKNSAFIVQARYELNPEYINADLSFTREEVELSPALLNPGDTITVQLFTSGPKPKLGVDARIEGVHTIFKEDFSRNPYWGEVSWINYLVYILAVFNMMLVGIVLKTHSEGKYLVLHKSAGCTLFASLALVSLYTYFSLMADHAMTVFASKLLLLAVSLLALLGAWMLQSRSETA